MEMMLNKEQLDELFSSDPREELDLTEEELLVWYARSNAEMQEWDDINPYRNL